MCLTGQFMQDTCSKARFAEEDVGSKVAQCWSLPWQKKTFCPFIVTQGRKAEVTKEVCGLIYLKFDHNFLIQVYGRVFLTNGVAL